MSSFISLISLIEEIKVIGLSYQKLGLPGTVESLEKMWEIYGEKHRYKLKSAVNPFVDYGINTALSSDKHEYIAGCAVTDINELEDNWTSFIVPPGLYIKHSRRKMEDLFIFENDVKIWAESNGYTINEEFMVEVYPDGAFIKRDVDVYTLTPIKKRGKKI